MPVSSNDSRAVGRRARALLAGGDCASPLVRAAGQVGEAVPVLHPDGGLHSWFVPITVDGRIVGFFQLLPEPTLLARVKAAGAAGCVLPVYSARLVRPSPSRSPRAMRRPRTGPRGAPVSVRCWRPLPVAFTR